MAEDKHITFANLRKLLTDFRKEYPQMNASDLEWVMSEDVIDDLVTKNYNADIERWNKQITDAPYLLKDDLRNLLFKSARERSKRPVRVFGISIVIKDGQGILKLRQAARDE